MVSDLLHLIFGQQLSPGATVTGLRARLALLPVLLQQFLRFLPRLRSTLLTSLRHIRRRRRGTVARTRGGFLLQHPQPLLQTQLPIHQPHQELNARLPTRIIDRLSLRPLHTDKVRRPPERTLLWKARRTERLRNKSHLQLLRKWSQPGSNRRPPACKVGAATAHTLPHGVSNRDSGRFRPVEPLTRCHCLPQPLAPYLLPDGVGIGTREHHNPTGYGRRRRHRQNSAGSGRCGTAGPTDPPTAAAPRPPAPQSHAPPSRADRQSDGGSEHWCRRTPSAPPSGPLTTRTSNDLVPRSAALAGRNGNTPGQLKEIGSLSDHRPGPLNTEQQLVSRV